MAVCVRTRLRGAGTASNHRPGSPGDFWRRQRLLREAPARRLQREGPTRTQFPPAPARMAPGTNGPNAAVGWISRQKSSRRPVEGELFLLTSLFIELIEHRTQSTWPNCL